VSLDPAVPSGVVPPSQRPAKRRSGPRPARAPPGLLGLPDRVWASRRSPPSTRVPVGAATAAGGVTWPAEAAPLPVHGPRGRGPLDRFAAMVSRSPVAAAGFPRAGEEGPRSRPSSGGLTGHADEGSGGWWAVGNGPGAEGPRSSGGRDAHPLPKRWRRKQMRFFEKVVKNLLTFY
jgi:hypothetical protein